MGHRVLGVTVDDDVVRVAVIETRLRRFTLVDAFEVPRVANLAVPAWADEQADPGAQTASIGEVARARVVDLINRRLSPSVGVSDSIAMVLPGATGFVRTLDLPFKESARIMAVLPNQMVENLPIPAEQLHCAYTKIAPLPVGARVLAVGVQREDLTAFLDGTRADGIEPTFLCLDGLALLSLLPYLPATAPSTTRLVIWAENNHANLVVATDGLPSVVRTVSLSEPLVPGSEVPPSLLREVLLTATAVSESGVGIQETWVAGPAAEAMVEPLTDLLHVPCGVLDAANLAIDGASSLSGLSPRLTMAVAAAVGEVVREGAGSLNLRVGSFSREEGYSLFRERFNYFAIAALVLVVLAAGSILARYSGLKAERDRGLAELKAFTTEVMGRERDDFDAVLKTMKSMSEDDLRIFPRWTAVDIANRILGVMMDVGRPLAGGAPAPAPEGAAEGVPLVTAGGHRIELENLRIELKSASLKGEADSIETLDAMLARLKEDPCLYDVITENTERIQFQRHQGWQRFSMRMSVDCLQKEGGRKGKAVAAKAKATPTDRDEEVE